MVVPLKDRVSLWIWEYGLKPTATAGVLVLIALLWTFPLQHVMAYPFVFLFFGAIVGSAWFGGFLAGLIAMVISYFVIAFFFIPLFVLLSCAIRSLQGRSWGLIRPWVPEASSLSDMVGVP